MIYSKTSANGQLFTFDINTFKQKQVIYNWVIFTSTLYAQATGDGNRAAYSSRTGAGGSFEAYVKTADVTDEQVLQVGPDNGTLERIEVDFEDMGSGSLGVWGVTLSRTDGAQAAITKIDAAIGKVSDKRAEIGILSGRLEHVINDLTAENINTSAARSRIEDADMSAEMTALIRTQLLESTGIQAISLGNEAAKSIMSLLSNV